MKKSQNGITLVALVITIIILLILAGVTLSIVFNGGIIEKSANAVDKYENSSANEKNQMEWTQNMFDKFYHNATNRSAYNQEENGVDIITGFNNNDSGVVSYVVEKDDDHAVICSGQSSLQYSINSQDDFHSDLTLLGSQTDNCGLYYTTISVKKGDTIYLKRNTTRLWGYAILYSNNVLNAIVSGSNNSGSGITAITIEHDNENAVICSGQVSLQYSINSQDNFQDITNLLGSQTDYCGLYYTTISVKEGDIIYLKRDTSRLWGYLLYY